MSKDGRDWKQYNENLVQRGEILLSVKVLRGWRKEVAKMNDGKKGRPFAYPDMMILLYGMMRAAFQLPYRQLEGFGCGLAKLIDIPSPGYTTLSIRLPKIKLGPHPNLDPDKPVVPAIDSSGVKLNQQGGWRYQQFTRKDWVKVHVMVDVESKKVVSVKLSQGHRHDVNYFYDLLLDAEKKVKIKRIFADSAYDGSRNYHLMRIRGIEPGIRPKSNTNFVWKKPPRTARTAAVRKWIDDPEAWKEKSGVWATFDCRKLFWVI